MGAAGDSPLKDVSGTHTSAVDARAQSTSEPTSALSLQEAPSPPSAGASAESTQAKGTLVDGATAEGAPGESALEQEKTLLRTSGRVRVPVQRDYPPAEEPARPPSARKRVVGSVQDSGEAPGDGLLDGMMDGLPDTVTMRKRLRATESRAPASPAKKSATASPAKKSVTASPTKKSVTVSPKKRNTLPAKQSVSSSPKKNGGTSPAKERSPQASPVRNKSTSPKAEPGSPRNEHPLRIKLPRQPSLDTTRGVSGARSEQQGSSPRKDATPSTPQKETTTKGPREDSLPKTPKKEGADSVGQKAKETASPIRSGTGSPARSKQSSQSARPPRAAKDAALESMAASQRLPPIPVERLPSKDSKKARRAAQRAAKRAAANAALALDPSQNASSAQPGASKPPADMPKKHSHKSSSGAKKPSVQTQPEKSQSKQKTAQRVSLRLGEPPSLKHTPVANYETCSACSGGGSLICCEACPHSFHLDCLDPPMAEEDIPADAWFCVPCSRVRRGQPAAPSFSKRIAGVGGVWAHLSATAAARNPTAFTIPKRIRRAAKGTELRVAHAAAPHHMQHAHSLEEHAVNHTPTSVAVQSRTTDSGWCHWCGRCAHDGRVLGALLRCDRCSLRWHLDCLPEPAIGPPRADRPWSCPAHLDVANLEAAGLSAKDIRRVLGSPAIVPGADEPQDYGASAPLAALAAADAEAAVSHARVPEPMVRLQLRWIAEGAAATNLVALSPAGGCAIPPDVYAAYRFLRSPRV